MPSASNGTDYDPLGTRRGWLDRPNDLEGLAAGLAGCEYSNDEVATRAPGSATELTITREKKEQAELKVKLGPGSATELTITRESGLGARQRASQ